MTQNEPPAGAESASAPVHGDGDSAARDSIALQADTASLMDLSDSHLDGDADPTGENPPGGSPGLGGEGHTLNALSGTP